MNKIYTRARNFMVMYLILLMFSFFIVFYFYGLEGLLISIFVSFFSMGFMLNGNLVDTMNSKGPVVYFKRKNND